MLDRARVENFQSIHEADLELGRFTVIVGPSNSGKSAFLRALRVLAYNAASPSFVSHGKKASKITLHVGKIGVSLERGKSLSTYRLTGPGGSEEVYAKSGTNVPEDIRKALGFVEIEGESLNFAGQFDRPFLLAEPPTKVAKVLGDLTNINVLYEAVREANRRRMDTSGKLKVRNGDLASLLGQLQEYKDLPTRKKTLERARESYDQAVNLAGRISQLDEVVVGIRTREAALDYLLEQTASDVSVDIESMEAKLSTIVSLRRLVDDIVQLAPKLKAATAEASTLGDEIEALDAKYHETLTEAGVCPVCNQEVK